MKAIGWTALAVLPLGFLGAMFLCFSPDYPYLDQWEFVPFLDKFYSGSISFVDFWAQHNEHRIVFPRAIMLACAYATHWDPRAELAVNFFLGIAIFAVWIVHARHAGLRDAWLPAALSLLAFSLSQWQNWFLGWQLQVFLSVLGVCGCAALLPAALRDTRAFLGAAVCATVATYSFANGMLAWPLGAFALVCLRREHPGRFPVVLAAWICVGAPEIAAYLWGYARPAYHPPAGDVLAQPVSFIRYVLCYLGQPVCNLSSSGATLAGAAGLAAWTFFLARQKRDSVPILWAPAMFLGLYAIASAAITGAARLDMGGVDQAMSSRYATLANLLWFSLALLAFLNGGDRLRRGLTAAVAMLVFLSSLHGAYRWTEHYHAYAPAREALLRGDSPELLQRIYPKPDTVLERRVTLEARGLSLFRKER